VLMIIGAFFAMIAFLADLLAVNRMLLEDIQYRQRRDHYEKSEGKR